MRKEETKQYCYKRSGEYLYRLKKVYDMVKIMRVCDGTLDE